MRKLITILVAMALFFSCKEEFTQHEVSYSINSDNEISSAFFYINGKRLKLKTDAFNWDTTFNQSSEHVLLIRVNPFYDSSLIKTIIQVDGINVAEASTDTINFPSTTGVQYTIN